VTHRDIAKKTMKKKKNKKTDISDRSRERERESETKKGTVLRHLEEETIIKKISRKFFLFNISHHSVYIYIY